MFNVDAERHRDAIQNLNGRVALSALHTAQVGLMDGSQMRELLLRQTTLAPGILQIQANADPHIHEAMEGTGLVAPIDYKS